MASKQPNKRYSRARQRLRPYRPIKAVRTLPGNYLRALPGGGAPVAENALTIVVAADTHVGSENNDLADPNVRQVAAINDMPGKTHPQGGFIGPIGALLVVGDWKHEDTESIDRAVSYYMDSGPAGVRTPTHLLIDGNHDQNDVRDFIIQEHGSLTWGRKIGPIWFQALTENYTAPFVTTPPSVAQINGPVAASVNARPIDEPVIFCLHRVLMDGNSYLAEWDPAALDALEVLMKSRRTVGIIYGHDHYVHHTSWRGIRSFTPGSVRQEPEDAPYSTTYAEVFLVMRLTSKWYDVAAYRFGYDVNRAYSPGVFEWAERVYY